MMTADIKRGEKIKKRQEYTYIHTYDDDDIFGSKTPQEPNAQKTFKSQEINLCSGPIE